MGNLLQTCLTVDEAYTVIVRFMGRLFPNTIGMLSMLGNSSNTLESVATWLGTATEPPLLHGR